MAETLPADPTVREALADDTAAFLARLADDWSEISAADKLALERVQSTVPLADLEALERIVQARIARALSAPEKAGWRTDMENAPRDGTKVDLWVVSHDAFTNGNSGRIPDAVFRYWTWFRRLNGEHWTEVGECGTPTHWRFPPPPPSVPDGQEVKPDVQDRGGAS